MAATIAWAVFYRVLEEEYINWKWNLVLNSNDGIPLLTKELISKKTT